LGRNKVWLIAKNYKPTRRLLAYLPLIVLYDLAAMLFALVVQRNVHSLLGRVQGTIGLPGVWRNRWTDQALIQSIQGSPWYRHLEPLVWPWQIPQRYRHIVTIARSTESVAHE
jgi:hypothetical protein